MPIAKMRQYSAFDHKLDRKPLTSKPPRADVNENTRLVTSASALNTLLLKSS
jgi:hypothetical protein